MGCDIHLMTESKHVMDGNEVWVNCDNWVYNRYFETDPDYENEYDLIPLYRDRNYTLFSILAGVRSHGNVIKPISEPKGVPSDVHKVTKELIDRWDGDGHSHSYFTLAELKKHRENNDFVVEYSGMVSPDAAKKLDEDGVNPTMWCQWTTMDDWVHRSWTVDEGDILDELIRLLQERRNEAFYLGDWRTEEENEKFDSKIRIVFFFDN